MSAVLVCACGGALLGMGERAPGAFAVFVGLALAVLDALEKGLV